MANLFSYVEKYGDKTFTEKVFNEVDNCIFSLLSYLNFSNTSINKDKYTLEEIGKEYLQKYKYRQIAKIGIAQRSAYKLLVAIVEKERYKSILLTSYIYNTNKEMQFSAITFHISHKLKYICFEGTDERISGWKEDGKMVYAFPIPSHIEAIKYVNKYVKRFGPKVILGGHSKGGNLALVAAMYMKKYKKCKVEKVYSNDGPGLRKKEFNSKEYKEIKEKYIHIVPTGSIVGILLRNDSYKVIETVKGSMFSHSMTSWRVQDDHFVPSELSTKTKKLEKNILAWLDKHDDSEREKVFRAVFKALDDADIEALMNIKEIKNIKKLLHNLKNIDAEARGLAIDFITYIVKNGKTKNENKPNTLPKV